MKKIYLLLLLIFIVVATKAQTDKRTFVIGGSLSYHYHHQTNPNTTEHKDYNIFLYPTTGYFIKDRLSLNLLFVYGSTTTHHIDNGHHHTTINARNYGIAPNLRYYFLLGKRAAFHLQLQAQYDRGRTMINDNIGKTYFNVSGGIRPGFSLFVTEKLGIEAQAGLLSYVYGEDLVAGEKYYHRNFYANIAPASLNFGLYFYL